MVKLALFPKDLGVLICNALMVVAIFPQNDIFQNEFGEFDVYFRLLAVEIFLVGLGTWHLCCGAEPLPCTMWPGLQAGVDTNNRVVIPQGRLESFCFKDLSCDIMWFCERTSSNIFQSSILSHDGSPEKNKLCVTLRPILIYNTLMVSRSFLSILHPLFYSKFFFASINGGPFAPTGPCRKPRKVGSVGDWCGAQFLGEFTVISFQFLRRHSSFTHERNRIKQQKEELQRCCFQKRCLHDLA